MVSLSSLSRGKYDDASRQMMAVLIGASAASQNGKNARCWTFASDELSVETNASFVTNQYTTASSDVCYGGTPSASSYVGSGSEASQAFDDNAASVWTSAAESSAWLKYVFGTGKIVRQYTVQGSISVDRNPSAWTFEGSNDGTTWTTLATVTGQTGWASNEKRTFQVTNSTSYTQYRIHITATNGGDYVNIAEMEMMVVGNVTLVPSAVAVASAPIRMAAYFYIQPIDAITLNTDLKCEVSRDGGSNWSSYGTLTLVGAYDATYNQYRVDFPLSALAASGTNILWRLTSYGKKHIRIKGATLHLEL